MTMTMTMIIILKPTPPTSMLAALQRLHPQQPTPIVPLPYLFLLQTKRRRARPCSQVDGKRVMFTSTSVFRFSFIVAAWRVVTLVLRDDVLQVPLSSHESFPVDSRVLFRFVGLRVWFGLQCISLSVRFTVHGSAPAICCVLIIELVLLIRTTIQFQY